MTFTSRSIVAACLAVASVLGCDTVAVATVDLGTVQVSSIGHIFTPQTAGGGPLVRDFLIDQQQSSGGGGMISPVSANFDVNNQFRLTIAAPAGQKFLVHVPAGASVHFDGVLAWSHPDGYYAYDEGSVSASFGGLEGIAPTFANAGARIAEDHAAFGFESLYSSVISNDIVFASITLTATVFTQNIGRGTVNYLPSTMAQNIFYVSYSPKDAQSDPGRFVSIVPEPSAMSLLGLGLILVAGLTWPPTMPTKRNSRRFRRQRRLEL